MKHILTLSLLLFTSSFVSAADVTFDVKPSSRYRIAYEWQATGPLKDFHADPLARSKVFDYRGGEYPVQWLYLVNAEGAESVQSRNTLVPETAGGMGGKMTWELYTGKATAKIRVNVRQPKGVKIALANATCEEVVNNPILNVNPDFAFGLYNYCGVYGSNDNAVLMLKNPEEGNSVFTGFYLHFGPTPVKPGKTYNLELKAQGWHRKMRMDGSFVFYNAEGKKCFQNAIPRYGRDSKKPNESLVKNIEFIAPEDAVSVSLWIYSGTIDYWRITEK